MRRKKTMKKSAYHGGFRENAGRKLKYEHFGQKEPLITVKIPADITVQELEQWIKETLIKKSK